MVSLKKRGAYNFKKHVKPILTFFFMAASISIYTNLDKVMLGFMKTNVDVGYYDASVKIKTILVSVVTSLGTVLLPRMSFYIEKGEKEAFQKTVTKAFRFVMVAATGLMVFFILFARESILLLSGDEFLPAVLPMQLLMVTLLLIGLSNITGIQILTPMGQEQKVLISIVAGAVVDFVLNLALIPRYSSSGALLPPLWRSGCTCGTMYLYERYVEKSCEKYKFYKIIFCRLSVRGQDLYWLKD